MRNTKSQKDQQEDQFKPSKAKQWREGRGRVLLLTAWLAGWLVGLSLRVCGVAMAAVLSVAVRGEGNPAELLRLQPLCLHHACTLRALRLPSARSLAHSFAFASSPAHSTRSLSLTLSLSLILYHCILPDLNLSPHLPAPLCNPCLPLSQPRTGTAHLLGTHSLTHSVK